MASEDQSVWFEYLLPEYLRPSPTFAAKKDADAALAAKLPVNMLTIGELSENPTDEDFAAWKAKFDSDAAKTENKDDPKYKLIKNTHAYTPNLGSDGFRAAAAWRYSQDTGIETAPSEVAAGCGSKAVLRGIFSVFRPGDEIIMASPGWPTNFDMPPPGVKIIEVDTGGRGLMSKELLETTLALHPNAKAVLLNSPCNPTGQKYSKEEREEIMGVLKQHAENSPHKINNVPDVKDRRPGFLVIEDNPYGKLVFDGSDQIAGPNEKELFASGKLVATRTLSKEYGMAGDAVGYAATKNPVIIQQINIWNDNNRTAPTARSMNDAQLALMYGDQFIANTIQKLKEKADIVYNALNDLNGITLNKPEGTLYAWVDFKALKGRKVAADKMLDKQETVLDTPEAMRRFLNEVCHACGVRGDAFFAPGSLLAKDCWAMRIGFAGDAQKLAATMEKIKVEVGQLIEPDRAAERLESKPHPRLRRGGNDGFPPR